MLSNYDIYKKAGGANKTIVEDLPVTADSTGTITVQFTSVIDNAMINGIEVDTASGTQPNPTPTPTPDTSVTINAGGTTASTYVADKDYVNGQTYNTTATVDTSGITNPAPQAVYQSVRYGNFTYNIPDLSPNSTYTVKLHFNELYWNAAGKRIFNTSINGNQVLTNYDIYQDASGENKAVVKHFTATADANGIISITFTSVTDNAMVSGIEISL